MPNRTVRTILTLSLVVGGLAGCREAGPPVRVRAPNQMPFRADAGLLSAGAEPVVAPGVSFDTFGADVTPTFIPIVVGVRNDLDEHVLLVRKEIVLRASDGTESRPVSWRALRNEYKDDLGLAPLFGEAAMADERERNQDRFVQWEAMELDEQRTIEGGGRGGGGFVFFRREKIGAPPHELVLRVQKLKSSDAVEITIEVPNIPAEE